MKLLSNLNFQLITLQKSSKPSPSVQVSPGCFLFLLLLRFLFLRLSGADWTAPASFYRTHFHLSVIFSTTFKVLTPESLLWVVSAVVVTVETNVVLRSTITRNLVVLHSCLITGRASCSADRCTAAGTCRTRVTIHLFSISTIMAASGGRPRLRYGSFLLQCLTSHRCTARTRRPRP